MRFLLILLLALLASVFLGRLLAEDTGYVLLSYGVWTLETSLSVFGLLLLLGFGLLYLLLRLMAGLLSTPSRWRGWRHGRETRGAYQTLLEGLKALEERTWALAEQRLCRAAAEMDVALIPWLGAARAAHFRCDLAARDRYLDLAGQETPGAELAVGLARAELQLAAGEAEAARATLETLLAAVPRNPQVLGLLGPVYRDLADWPDLSKLLAPLRKYGGLPEAELVGLEDAAYLGLLERVSDEGRRALQAQWERIPRAAQVRPRLVVGFSDQLIALGGQEQAETLIRKALQRDWNRLLIERYGLAGGRDPAAQLAWAERFLGTHPDDPKLLLTLGRLCVSNRLWGKARTYLEASLHAEPLPEVFEELGRLLEQLGEQKAALECYRRGLTRLIRTPPAEVAESPEASGLDFDATRDAEAATASGQGKRSALLLPTPLTVES
jgi:HemY protein